ncbi:hypothetical protein AOLI_G00000790 [Acnodon oligacanthus]
MQEPKVEPLAAHFLRDSVMVECTLLEVFLRHGNDLHAAQIPLAECSWLRAERWGGVTPDMSAVARRGLKNCAHCSLLQNTTYPCSSLD